TNYLAYNLDATANNWVALSDLGNGSGKADITLLIPDSDFIHDAAHRYVTLYSAFGQQGGDWNSGGGFEEWGVRSTGGAAGTTASLEISKSATVPGGTADHAGEAISYTIQLDNTGDMALTGVTLTDPLLQGAFGTLGAPTESISANGVLDVGETWTYHGSYTVQQSDIDNGTTEFSIDNTAT